MIESPRFGRVLVSGGGIYGHVTYVRGVEGARYRAARSGYLRIDFLRDGSRRLAVVEVAQDGAAREAYSSFLR